MKSIINGFRYDTDKAILIGFYYSDLSRSDFNYWEAGLYKTPRAGRFFLAGEGHGMTKYGADHGEMRGWGSKIIPINSQEAMIWAESYLDIDTVEKHFEDDIQEA